VVSAEPAGDGVLAVTVTAPEGTTEAAVSFACGPGEQFRGLGAQTFSTDHRGATVPIWVVEQGLGKVTPDTPSPPPSLMGEPYDSYMPIPWVMSSQGWGVSLDSRAYAEFELCTEDHPDSWRLRVWDRSFTFHLVVADTPRATLSAYARLVGLPEHGPPSWFWAPVNDAVRGRANVERVAALLREEDIPSSVIWTEDWIGLGSAATGLRLSHDWDVDPEDYPDMAAMTDGLHRDGFRFLGYFSPFIPDSASTPGGQGTLPSGQQVTLHPQNEPKWSEALAGGFTFTDPDGEPYRMLTPPFQPPPGSALDLTDRAAVEWFQGWLAEAEALGLDGSMTDFGEWVPFDARFADGRTGAEVHNEYPVLWQRANREFWERARPDGDWLFYVRSGHTGTQSAAPAVWAGDQNTTWDRLDGLGSVVTYGVNLGLSGIAFFGSDIAGYSAFAFEGIENTPTSRELFWRWTELGAFTPMMRTHHGSRYGENWSFEGAPNPADPVRPVRDDETLTTWRRYATEHVSLFPYLQAAGEEAVESGIPVMRHLWLEFPDDEVVAGGVPDDPAWADFAAVGGGLPEGELFEYLLGPDLLVAPVIDEGATSRPVYLPGRRDWVEIHTGERFGPGSHVVEAPLGEIPVFARVGTVLPRLPEGVDTLAVTDAEGVVDHEDVAGEMVLDVVLGARGSATLADGTRIALDSAAGDRVDAAGDGAGPVGRGIVPTGAVAQVVTGPMGDGEVQVGDAVVRIEDSARERTWTIRALLADPAP
jgi:alpha-glucosidase (family GH31 glycosyl hydrolase)